jgi:hypothetical protein
MDQSQDATRIHLGNIYNGKRKHRNISTGITLLLQIQMYTLRTMEWLCGFVALPDISSRARLIDI